MQPTEPVHVLEDEGEGIQGRLAEKDIGEGDLDVGILSDELNALLEEPKAVARVAKHAFDAGVLVSGLDLPAVVLKEEANELTYGDQGGAERNRAHMVPEAPPYASADGSLATSVTVHFEVPNASRCSNDELAAAHDEGVDPEEHKELVDDDVPSVFVPLHLSDEFVSGARHGLTNGENEDGADEPAAQPNSSEEICNDGQDIDPQVAHHVLSCRLVDCDADPDSIPAAAHAAEVECGNAPNTVRGVLDPVTIVATLRVLLVLHVSISTAAYQSNLKQND